MAPRVLSSPVFHGKNLWDMPDMKILIRGTGLRALASGAAPEKGAQIRLYLLKTDREGTRNEG